MTEHAGFRREATFEQAVMVVRLVLSVLALVLVTGDSISSSSMSVLASAVWPVAVFGVASLWNAGAWLIGRSLQNVDPEAHPRRSRALLSVLHAGDTIGGVALTFAVGEVSAGSSWVLLTVPIVVASVRFSSRAVIATWFGVSVGYLATDQLWPSHFDIGAGGLTEQSGLLLAVAASVALMTRWLEEGWRAQAEITVEVEQARDQLNVIQAASQSMRSGPPPQILEVTTRSAVSLGFEACVVTVDNEAKFVAGDGSFVPTNVDMAPTSGNGDLTGVELTAWVDDNGERCHSATVVEPRTGAVVAGWSRQPIAANQASSLVQLVSHASTNIEAGRHLAHARYAASHDPLTRTANRATINAFVDRVEPSHDPFIGAIFIDLDHFKAVNDTHGHAVGDQLLVSIARRIQSVAGRTCLAGRYGGDEFIVLCDVADPAALIVAAERIRKKLAEPHALSGLEIRSSASIGVAHATHADRGHLLEWADQAAYEAKRGGRNRVIVHRVQSAKPARASHHASQGPGG